MTYLDQIDKLHPDLISAFLTSGHCDGIPVENTTIPQAASMGSGGIRV